MRTPVITFRRRRSGSHEGFTLIEAAVFLFLFSVITLTFYELFSLGSAHILDVRRKLTASALASERMEMVRSLPYDSIGTRMSDGSGGWTYGIPAGDIIETETVERTGGIFSVHTIVQYEDDPFDGTADGSSDVIPTDYKRVRVGVSWGEVSDARQVVMWSTFSPDGVEQPSNTGVLSVNVLDPAGDPVSGATVRIASASSHIDLSAGTDAYGNQSWPGTPPSDDYMVIVSKDGYSGVQTYPPYPDSAFDPLDPPMSVVAGSVNQKTFTIGRFSEISIRSEDPFGATIPSVPFTLSGGTQIGTAPLPADPDPVYEFSVSGTTDAGGERTYTDRSYGTYAISLDGSVAGYRFLRIESSGTEVEGGLFPVAADGETEARMIFADTDLPSLVVSVITVVESGEATTEESVPGATVRLRNEALGYDTVVTADLSGTAYFPTEATGLPAGTYEYEVSADGYATETGTVVVTGPGLQDASVTLSSE